MSEFNELLDLDLPLTDEYQTLGGFLIYQLQKIPTQGEVFHYKNIEFTASAVKGPRVDQILVRRQKSATDLIMEEFTAANDAENKPSEPIPPDEDVDTKNW